MKRRPWNLLIPAVLALLAIGTWARFHHSRSSEKFQSAGAVTSSQPPSMNTPSAASIPAPVVAPGQSPLNLASPRIVSSAASSLPTQKPSQASTPFAPPDQTAMLEVDKVGLMLRDYRTLTGENPVGTNAEIMSALMGDNPKQAKLGPPEGMGLNEKGELIDRWGTPYFFHQLSRDHMEIRSAGPDKVMWTEDDPVIR